MVERNKRMLEGYAESYRLMAKMGDGKVSARDVAYDIQNNMVNGLAPTPKAPQDMNLRELFDHVAIVNDAIRAALLTHPGMTPPKSDGGQQSALECRLCGDINYPSAFQCEKCGAGLV